MIRFSLFSKEYVVAFLKGWVFCLLMMAASVSASHAQENSLNRISTAERSDGKGFVIRFHLEQEADSFEVFQPSPDLIQFKLHGENVDTSDISFPDHNAIYDEISFYQIPGGVGVDIYITEGRYFTANSYPDGNGNDLLMALTTSTREELEELTEGVDPLIWSRFNVLQEVAGIGRRSDVSSVSVFDESYNRIRDNMRFDVVVIDAGHGGHDTGAIGYGGVYEKDLTLAIAKKLGGYINEHLPDVEVVYTRDDDSFVELEKRGEIANRHRGDLFVSIHCNNHGNRHASGTEVYFLGLARSQQALEVMKRENSVVRLEDSDQSAELDEEELLIYEMANAGYMATSEKIAGMLDHQFEERAKRRTRGVKQAPFIVLFHASMPAVLVESGFISNPNEQRFLTSDYGQSIIASALFRAIRDYKDETEAGNRFTNSSP